jgi:hypothetical protein
MEFGLYVSPVKGHAVPRFGAPAGTYIGAKRVGKQLEWDEERIVAIPVNESRRYSAEYDGAIRDGSLKVRTAEEYAQQVDDRKAAKKRAAIEAAEAAKPADADAPAAKATGVRAIAETAPVVAPTERPRPILLDKDGK